MSEPQKSDAPVNMTACPGCGKHVHDRSPACPNCSEKIYVEHPGDITPVKHDQIPANLPKQE